MQSIVRNGQELELALLRRGVEDMVAGSVRCRRCRRTPLIGERIHVYGARSILCDLCRENEQREPHESHLVHGPEFGHTMKIVDRRE